MTVQDIVILKNLLFARITYARDRRESQHEPWRSVIGLVELMHANEVSRSALPNLS